ncbi:MAG: hypothetical protein KC483_09155 [Nitrosarchaeum sp.]|nr:hypothetical protein [Nitrosarchaeum sp.]MCA9819497.1 hypothetical protein [Nitrosarchaeum sp.]
MSQKQRTKIQQLLRYKKHTRQNSTSFLILQILYPNNCITIRKITSLTYPKSHAHTQTIMRRLVRAGYVDIADNIQKYGKQYRLTQTGRWFAISCKLRISFLSLCLLAEVYYAVSKNEPRSSSYIRDHNRMPEFYMISSFRRLFDSSYQESISAIYSKRNISKAARNLVDRKLAYRPYRSDILRISADGLTKLQRYDYDLCKLHWWNYEISSECRDIFVEDYVISDKQKKLFSLVC